MKKNSMPAVVLIAAGMLVGMQTLPAETYSLEQYLSKVEQENPDLELSRKQLSTAGELVNQALSSLLPSVGFSGGYTRNLKDVKKSTAVAATTTAVNSMYPLIYQNIDSNYDNEVTVGISVTQKLIDPESIAKYAQARKNRTMQQAVTEYTRQQVLTAAKKLYAQVQLLQAVAKVKKETAQISQAVYLDIEKKYNAGTSTELDLRMAEVDWKSDISEASRAAKNASLAMMSLKTLAGISQNVDMELSENTENLPAIPEKEPLSDVLSARMDYRAQLLSKEVADIGFRASLATFLPTVTSSFTYAYGQYGGYEGKDDWDAYDYTAAAIGLKVTVPLFTGGYRLSLVKRAEINRASADIQIRKRKDSIEQDLESLQLQLDEAKKQVESARALEEASTRALTIARAAFTNGLGTQLEVSQAMSKAAESRVNLQNAIYVYRAAYYDWVFTNGQFENR